MVDNNTKGRSRGRSKARSGRTRQGLARSDVGFAGGSRRGLSARQGAVAALVVVLAAAVGCGQSGADVIVAGAGITAEVGEVEVPAASAATPPPLPAKAAQGLGPAGEDGAGPNRGQGLGPDSEEGPVGNVGGEGEMSGTTGVLPGPEDVPGGLWDAEVVWGRAALVDEVYDLCDDAQAFAVAMGRPMKSGEDITAETRQKIEDERRRWNVSCDVEGGNRHVYLDEHFLYPSRPSAEEVLADPKVEARIKYAEYRANYLPPGTPLGYRGVGGSISNSRIIWEDEGSQVEVVPSTVSVTGGTIRGLVANRTKTLFARNVTVTVQEKGTQASPVTGGWPLTIQPAENAPFEITGWTGSTDPQNLDIRVSADLSPSIDLSRSFKIQALLVWQGRVLVYENDYRDLFPAQVINTQDQEIPDEGFYAVSGDASAILPPSHPSLKDKFDSLTFDDLRAYAAFFDDDRRVVRILKLATYTINESGDPYTVAPITSHDSFEFNFIAETLDFAVWVGNANKTQT